MEGGAAAGLEAGIPEHLLALVVVGSFELPQLAGCLRWLSQGGALIFLIGAIAFGIINRCEAVQSAVELSAKESGSRFAGAIVIAEPTTQIEKPSFGTLGMERPTVPVGRSQNPKTICDRIVARADYVVLNKVGDVRPIRTIFKIDGAFRYCGSTCPGIDDDKFNYEGLLLWRDVIFERPHPQGMNFHLGAMGGSKFLAGQIDLVSEKIVLSSGSPPECAGETSDCDSRERGESASIVIRGFDDLPEKGKRDVIGGALFCIGIFILAAVFAVYGDKKRNRHGYSKYEKKSHYDDDEPMS